MESRLEAMLDAVRVEAEARVRDAERQAREREEGLVAEFAAAEQEMSVRLAAESAAQVAAESARLDARRARYERVDADEAHALAEWVVEEVLRTAAGVAR